MACTMLKVVIATRPSFCRRGSMTMFIATIRSALSTRSSMIWTSMRQALPGLSRKTPAVQLTIRPTCSSSTFMATSIGCAPAAGLRPRPGRNLEVIWLLCGLCPDFKTIADFRKDNRNAFKAVFREFGLLCRKLDLFGRELVAVDGTRLKAVNSTDRNFTHEKLKRLIQWADDRLADYLARLDRADGTDNAASSTPATNLAEKIAILKGRRGRYV